MPAYSAVVVQSFLAQRVDLRDFCFKLEHEFKARYAYAFLAGQTPPQKSMSLVAIAEQFAELGEVIFRLADYWINDVHGNARVLVMAGLHEQMALYRQELIERGDQQGAEQVLALLKIILSESLLREVLLQVAAAPVPGERQPPVPEPPVPEPPVRAQPAEQPPAENTLTIRFHELQSGTVQINWDADAIGQHTSLFRPPYAAATLLTVIKALNAIQYPNHPIHGPRFDEAERAQLAALDLWEGDRVAARALERIGGRLYDALQEDANAQIALHGARNYATMQDQPLTYLLHFPCDAIELAMLPWELLRDRYGPLLLGRGKMHNLIRYLDLDVPLPSPRKPGSTLRILAISPHADIPPQVRDEERAEREQAWKELSDAGIVQMESLRPATPRALGDRMREGPQVDIVHFFGHGRYTNGQGALLFDTPDGGKTWLSNDKLAVALGGTRLVVLHACQSAMVGGAGLMTGVGTALCAAGVTAVVAMQCIVRTTAATRFSGMLYRALARGESLQHAVGQGRHALYLEEDDGVSWCVPILIIRARDTGPLYLIEPQWML